MTLDELRDYARKFNIRVVIDGAGFAVYRLVSGRAVYQGRTSALPYAEKLVKKLCDSACHGKA